MMMMMMMIVMRMTMMMVIMMMMMMTMKMIYAVNHILSDATIEFTLPNNISKDNSHVIFTLKLFNMQQNMTSWTFDICQSQTLSEKKFNWMFTISIIFGHKSHLLLKTFKY